MLLLGTFADKRLLANNFTVLLASISNLHRHQLNKPSQAFDHPIGSTPNFCEPTCRSGIYASFSDTIIFSLLEIRLTLCLGTYFSSDFVCKSCVSFCVFVHIKFNLLTTCCRLNFIWWFALFVSFNYQLCMFGNWSFLYCSCNIF